MLILSLLACHQSFDYTVQQAASAPLPDLDADCVPDETATTDGETNVWTFVAPIEAACGVTVLTLSPLVAWDEVQAELDQYRAHLDGWTSTESSFPSLVVRSGQAPVAPAGATLRLGQYLVDDSQRRAIVEGEPIPSLGEFAAETDLVSFSYVTTGNETDLAGVVAVEQGQSAVETLNRTFPNDQVWLATQVTLDVPFDVLAEVPLTDLTVDTTEDIVLFGEVCVFGCGGP